jgi:hypothetical protein
MKRCRHGDSISLKARTSRCVAIKCRAGHVLARLCSSMSGVQITLSTVTHILEVSAVVETFMSAYIYICTLIDQLHSRGDVFLIYPTASLLRVSQNSYKMFLRFKYFCRNAHLSRDEVTVKLSLYLTSYQAMKTSCA